MRWEALKEEYEEILNRYNYESDQNIKTRISELNKESFSDNKDAINEIVLWKLNRSVHISDDTISLLNSLYYLNNPQELLKDNSVHKLISELLASKGIQLPMASTILHFYYPNIFPIIDQRAYRELFGEDLPKYNDKNRNRKYTELYLNYAIKCYQFNLHECPDISFNYIDKILYQLDKEKGNSVKY